MISVVEEAAGLAQEASRLVVGATKAVLEEVGAAV
jgi:hypothetical protein